MPTRFTQQNLLFVYCFCALALLLQACTSKNKYIVIDPAYSKYIEAYTSGTVSKKSNIRIQLATDASVTHTLQEPIAETLFSFSPSVKGKTYWIDARTIEFKPDTDLEKDVLYEVKFKLNEVLNVPDKYKNFKFNIQTIKPSFSVETFGLKTDNATHMTLTGEIKTADVEESKSVEKILTASCSSQSLSILWQHNEGDKTHGFIIQNIQKITSEQTLKLTYNGNALRIDKQGTENISIPEKGVFKVLGAKAIQDNEQYTLVQFSEPLAIAQSLDGLISISNQESLSYTILGSEAKVYSNNNLDGNFTASIYEGVENFINKKLEKNFTANIFFENRLPTVNIQGKGVILPNSTGKIVLPFEATNLKAVDVSVIKIYENNIAQFLQSNSIDGENELRRVAKPLVQATIQLDIDKSINLHKKNRFSLDLDKYIRAEPGAMYRVSIAFRPEYSVYACTENNTSENKDETEADDYYSDEQLDEDDAFWNRYNDYYPYGYNWEQKDNPCNKAYYNKQRFASRNILSTNIGLTAKRGTGNTLFVAANNLVTTEPLSNVELQVVDFQQQVVGKSVTNTEGIANIDFKRKPYLLIAKHALEKSYLKLDEGSSLMVSKFDVGGTYIKDGIKGFIFGERGVWRPGDSLFLSCIIEDKNQQLPKEHPIEMQLISPKGQLYKKIVQPNASNGFNVFKTVTDTEAPTGNWLCKVTIGGASFEKRIKIETVIPNRLKINLNFGNATTLGVHTNNNGILAAKWLFGATAQNLKARVDAQLYKKKTTFNKYTAYEFDNPTIQFSEQNKTIFDGTLNQEGIASINSVFGISTQAPGMLLANLVVKVFEPGGNFSIDNVSFDYHPYRSYAGIQIPEDKNNWGYLLSGKKHQFNLVNVNTDGQPIAQNTELEVELYKIQWRWWWDNTAEGLSNFTQDKYNKLIQKETISTQNGKATFSPYFNKEEWGRYLVLVKDVKSGHTTGKTFYVDNDDWRSRGNNEDASNATMLSFNADKEKYQVGDKATITIPTSKQGRALITIETGSKVLKHFWINTNEGQTKYSFTIEKEMCPNVYVSVSLLQPHAQTINDLPIRMYGITPILVEDKTTILQPIIQMPSSIQAEQKNTITVSEANRKEMTYVIALVDEGLLDLTRFKTPNPHQEFYSKEGLGVKTWDVYDYVIGAWSGGLDRILTIGGDAEANAAKTRKANRFKPVVQFLGPFTSNGSSQTHSFTLPAYMGSIKAMVVAAGKGNYGMAEKSVAVKKPLMLLTTLPRVLAPTENIRIPVTIFNSDKKIKTVRLSIQSNPFIVVEGEQLVNFNTIGEQTVYLQATVKNNTGIGTIKITAAGGNEKAVATTEIDIRNLNPSITQVTEYVLQPNQSFSTTTLKIGDAMNSRAIIEIAAIPPINLQKRLNYLIQYPHGCIEQTTSAVFSQLMLGNLVELTDERKRNIQLNIKSAIIKIQNFQQADGGFSYWPGIEASDEWGTNYAGHFLIEAAAKGYIVPTNMLQQWKQYQKNKAVNWNISSAPTYGNDLIQAYRLYLLALNKSAEIGAMNRLKEYKFLTAEGKWRLAAAYYLAGQQQVAFSLISGLPKAFKEPSSPGNTFGSSLRDEAMVLETLTLMNRKAEATFLLKNIAAKLAQETWYSTQTTAYALIAIAKFVGTENNNSNIQVSGNINGKNISINSKQAITQNDVIWQNNKANISITNKGNKVVFVRIINEGKPVGTAPIAYKNSPSILLLNTQFFTTTGSPISIQSIKQGTDFVAKVTVKNPGFRGNYTQMALSQLFPSGWEIINTRMYNNEGSFKSSTYNYMDIKDDRVYHYFNIAPSETLTYYVQLNAAYLGKFYWPGVYIEAMYDQNISAGINGEWVEVTE